MTKAAFDKLRSLAVLLVEQHPIHHPVLPLIANHRIPRSSRQQPVLTAVCPSCLPIKLSRDKELCTLGATVIQILVEALQGLRRHRRSYHPKISFTFVMV